MKRISSDVQSLLIAYPWPGNVRELENVVNRASVIAQGDTILLKDLPPEIHEWASKNDLSPKSAATSPGKAPDTSSSNVEAAPIGKPIIGEASIEDIYDQLYDVLRSEGQEGILDLIERAMIKRALVESDGNQVKTAGILGITRATLRKRIDLYK